MADTNTGILSQIRFDEKGLVPVIVQDIGTGEVLMFAYMNEEALLTTLKTGRMYYYSRSRKNLWLKGEESGNFQELKEMRIDCDGDTLLCRVEQKKAACHKGYRSCFFRKLKSGDKNRFVITEERIFNPDEVYTK